MFVSAHLGENFWILNKNSRGYFILGSNWQYGSIDSDNGLAPKRQQATIWSNVDMLYWRIYASLGLNELTFIMDLDVALVLTDICPMTKHIINTRSVLTSSLSEDAFVFSCSIMTTTSIYTTGKSYGMFGKHKETLALDISICCV